MALAIAGSGYLLRLVTVHNALTIAIYSIGLYCLDGNKRAEGTLKLQLKLPADIAAIYGTLPSYE